MRKVSSLAAGALGVMIGVTGTLASLGYVAERGNPRERTGVVTVSGLRVRENCGTQYPVARIDGKEVYLDAGDKVNVVGEVNRNDNSSPWFMINYQGKQFCVASRGGDKQYVATSSEVRIPVQEAQIRILSESDVQLPSDINFKYGYAVGDKKIVVVRDTIKFLMPGETPEKNKMIRTERDAYIYVMSDDNILFQEQLGTQSFGIVLKGFRALDLVPGRNPKFAVVWLEGGNGRNAAVWSTTRIYELYGLNLRKIDEITDREFMFGHNRIVGINYIRKDDEVIGIKMSLYGIENDRFVRDHQLERKVTSVGNGLKESILKRSPLSEEEIKKYLGNDANLALLFAAMHPDIRAFDYVEPKNLDTAKLLTESMLLSSRSIPISAALAIISQAHYNRTMIDNQIRGKIERGEVDPYGYVQIEGPDGRRVWVRVQEGPYLPLYPNGKSVDPNDPRLDRDPYTGQITGMREYAPPPPPRQQNIITLVESGAGVVDDFLTKLLKPSNVK